MRVRPKRSLSFVTTFVAGTILLTGCGLFGVDDKGEEAGAAGGGEQEAEGEEQAVVEASDDAITSRPTNSWDLPGGVAEVSLHRVDDEHMVAQLTVTNEEGNDLHLSSHLAEGYGETEDYSWNYFSGIAWLDSDGRQLHRPYYADDEACLCSSTDDSYISEAGTTWEGYAVLAAPPQDVSALTVVTQVALPFIDIPIQEGAPEGIDYESPADVPGAEPELAELESVIKSDDESLIEDSESTDINLSTDVLFELEESELTTEADELIDDAAEEIQALNPTEVSVEGHADSSGTDDINDPLSEDRAESVRAALEERVDSDIDYDTAGFGSTEPIASNDDEEGRARNRRVTISVPRGTEIASEDEAADSDTASDAAEGESNDGEGTPAEEVSITGPAGDAFDEDLEVDVQLTGLRSITPSTALLTYELHNPNSGDMNVSLDMVSDLWSEFRYHATHAVTLDDPAGERTAHPLRVHPPDDRDQPYCFCSSTSGINLGSTMLSPEETHEYYAILPITPGTTVTDITMGEIGTLEGVAIA